MPTVIGDQAHGMRLATRELLEELESLLAAPCLDPGLANGQNLEPCARIGTESCRGGGSREIVWSADIN